MRIVFALILIIGMGLAGFAVYMAQGQFSEYQKALDIKNKALAKNVPLTKVYVAKEQLAYGQKLTRKHVRAVNWPVSAVPAGTFTSSKDLFPDKEDTMRYVLRAMEKDEAIMAVKITKPGEDAGVASRLATGMRAFTIRVDVASGVSGFLLPGNKVDVYWTGVNEGREVTKLILEGIRLIAIDQIADEDRNNPIVARTVTTEVAPEVVAALVQAQATGRLLLSLRGTEDTTSLGSIEVDQNQLLGIRKEEKVEVVEKKVCTIRSRKGATVQLIEIPCPEE